MAELASNRIEVFSETDLERTISNPNAQWTIKCKHLRIYFYVPEFSKQKLAEALVNSNLKSFGLSITEAEPTGLDQDDIIWISEVIARTKTITKLDLGRIDLTSETQQILAAALKTNTSIKTIILKDIKKDTEGRNIFNEVFKVNKTVKGLELRIANRYIPNENETSLETIDNLIEILTDSANTLTKLKIYHTTPFEYPDRGTLFLDALKQHTSITSLRLSAPNEISSDQLKYLADIILTNKRIARLYIDEIYFSEDDQQATDALCNIVSANILKKLELSECFHRDSTYEKVLNALDHDRTLEYFCMDKMALGRLNRYEKICNWLLKTEKIKEISLHFDYIDLTAKKVFGNLIKNHKSLEKLHLAYHSLFRRPKDQDKWIFEGLKFNSSLKVLRIDGPVIDGFSLDNIIEALTANESLTKLYIDIRLGLKSHKEQICKAVSVNGVLEKLKTREPIPGMEEVLANNIAKKTEFKIDWWILMNNIARQNSSFALFPSEIWLEILCRHQALGIATLGAIARKAFKKYGRI